MLKEETFQELFQVVKGQDGRIDYNFNTLIQTSILVEFLFTKLSELNPDLKLEELFEEFQTQRLEELDEIVKAAQESSVGEDISSIVKEEILDKIDL